MNIYYFTKQAKEKKSKKRKTECFFRYDFRKFQTLQDICYREALGSIRSLLGLAFGAWKRLQVAL